MFKWLQKFKVEYHRRFSEKRKYPRVPISVKVTKLESGTFAYYHATNISVAGIFLKSDEPPPVGSTLLLQFSLPEHDHEVKTEAKVVRVQHYDSNNGRHPTGMGLRFQGLVDQDRRAIAEFVDKKI